ncbi:MAG: LamG domain-containing protein [Candidatus Edwardsbacteria bacterium]|nr:LamG domain-containing protein [Candidatus Edwardsbacteria bacterium]
MSKIKKISYFVVIAVVLMCLGQANSGQERRVISVMNIATTSGITEPEALQLSKKLLNELVLRNSYDVVDIEKRDEILKEQGFQQSGACDATSCLVEAGKLLGVEKIIGGSIGKIGSVYSVELQMVDVLSGKVEKVYSSQCSGDPSQLLGLMKEASFSFSDIKFSGEDAVPPETIGNSPVIQKSENSPKYELPRGPVDLKKEMVAFFPFNGNADDESGNKRKGKVVNAVLDRDRFGNPERSYYFNGRNSYILCGNYSQEFLQSKYFTVSAFIRFATTRPGTIIQQGCWGSSWTGFSFYVNSICGYDAPSYVNAQINQTVLGSHIQLNGKGKLNDGKWHHVVLLRSDTNLITYVDGENNGIVQNYPSISLDNDLLLSIGSRYHPNDVAWYYEGNIDDVKIYSRVLSLDEIRSLYHEGGWAR